MLLLVFGVHSVLTLVILMFSMLVIVSHLFYELVTIDTHTHTHTRGWTAKYVHMFYFSSFIFVLCLWF